MENWEDMLDDDDDEVVIIKKKDQEEVKQQVSADKTQSQPVVQSKDSKPKTIKKETFVQKANRKELLVFKEGVSELNKMAGNQKMILKKQADFKKLAGQVCEKVRESHTETNQVMAFLNEMVVCAYICMDRSDLHDLWDYIKILQNQKKKQERDDKKKQKKQKKEQQKKKQPTKQKKKEEEDDFELNKLAMKETGYREYSSKPDDDDFL